MKKKMWFSGRDDEAVREIIRKLNAEGKAAKRTEQVTLFFAADDEIVTLTAIGIGQKRKALLQEPGEEERPILVAAFDTAQESKSVAKILPAEYLFAGIVKSLCATYTGAGTLVRIFRHTFENARTEVEVRISGRTDNVKEVIKQLEELHPKSSKSLYQRMLVHKS